MAGVIATPDVIEQFFSGASIQGVLDTVLEAGDAAPNTTHIEPMFWGLSGVTPNKIGE